MNNETTYKKKKFDYRKVKYNSSGLDDEIHLSHIHPFTAFVLLVAASLCFCPEASLRRMIAGFGATGPVVIGRTTSNIATWLAADVAQRQMGDTCIGQMEQDMGLER